MDIARNCHDMLANLLTPAIYKFLNGGVPDRVAINKSWRLLGQCIQQQSNALLRFEALSEEYANLHYAHESWKEMKLCYKECKKKMAKLCAKYDNNVSIYNQLLNDYNGVINTKNGLSERVEELEVKKKELEYINGKLADRIKQLEDELEKFVAKAHHLRKEREDFTSNKYKQSLGDVFSLAIAKGWVDGISVNMKEEVVQEILTDTPNVDLAATATFMAKYEALFYNRYFYVDKGRKPCFKDAPTRLKKWKDKFFLVDHRAIPVTMPWRHNDSSVADPPPGLGNLMHPKLNDYVKLS
nr:hypothetical protein [Tanacetum cinerariifolium]